MTARLSNALASALDARYLFNIRSGTAGGGGMMIMGGGFVSVLQGKLASPDSLGILNSYWVGVICFAYLAYYAVTMTQHFKKQGIEIGPATGGH